MLNQISALTTTVVHGVNISPGGQVLGANGRTVLACYAPGGGANLAPNCPFYDPQCREACTTSIRVTPCAA